MLQALLIDLDGTLADSHALLFQTFHLLLEEVGVKTTSEEFQSFVGPSIQQIANQLVDRYALPLSADALAARYLLRLRKLYGQGAIPLMAGAEQFLQQAVFRNLDLALVTSAPRALSQSFLSYHSLDKLFAIIVSADDVQMTKPHPEPFLKALEALAVSPVNAIAIDDSPTGCQSATSAGLLCWPFSQKEGGWLALTARLYDVP